MSAPDATARTLRIRALNDAARSALPHGLASCLITRGVQALPPEQVAQILEEVRSYANFTQGDDPYGEHDFGVLTRVARGGAVVWTQEPQSDPKHGMGAEKIFWKIDYYAKASDGVPGFTYGSETPEDGNATDRVLTIYLASEH